MDLIIGDMGCDAVDVWPLNNWKERNKNYNRHVEGEYFDYDYQGLWNHRELYQNKISEAKEYARKKNWKLIVNETL